MKQKFPSSYWPEHMHHLLLVSILGFALAFLTVSKPLFGLAAVGGAVALFVFTRRVEFPLGVFILSMAIPVQKTLGGIPVNMADGLILLWGAAWVFLMLKEDAPPLRLPFVALAALPFIVSAVLSQFGSINMGGSFKQVIRLVEWFVVLPMLMIALKSSPVTWRWIMGFFLVIPPLFALDGLVEVLTHGRTITGMIGIPPPIPSAEMSEIRHTFDISERAGSTFGGAQGLAMYLVMMMSVLLGMVLVPPSARLQKFALVSLAICLAGLVATQSRGGFLGTAVLFFVMVLVAYPRLAFSVFLVGGLAASGVVLWVFFWQGWDGTLAGMVPGRQEAVLDRLIIWERAVAVFLENPVLGVGFGNFRDAVYQEGGIHLHVGLGYESLHCHNTFLEVLTGVGLLGFLTYIGFLLACFFRLVASWREKKNAHPPNCFIVSAIGALSAYLVFGMVDMLFLQNMHFVLVMLITLGLLAAQPMMGLEKKESRLREDA